jgi:uncharacterized protein (TIGR02594 family)
MSMPKDFLWLLREKSPKILVEAIALIGTTEHAGTANNPTIMLWADECGIPRTSYAADSVPWCGLFAAICAHRSGKKVPSQPLWARNWLKFGEECEPELGAILVFSRGENSGHVGLYVAENAKNYFVLGGNQGDAVSIVPIEKSRLLGARCQYITKPANVRKVFIDFDGEVSTNEA